MVCAPAPPGPARPTGVLCVTAGQDAAALTRARQELATRGLPPTQIEGGCADLSPAYAPGVRAEFPAARLVFAFFHGVGLLTRAVDTVRRRESAVFPDLRTGTRYLGLKHEENLRACLQKSGRRQVAACIHHSANMILSFPRERGVVATGGKQNHVYRIITGKPG